MTNTDRLTNALADRYRIVEHLGEGGMATVYQAEDVKHKRKVAVKVLRPELAAVLGAERFVQEIETTASLQHPHILPLFDSGEADGFLYYVMPYIEGETLRDKLNRETQLGIEEAVRVASEVADALDYAHRHGVIHRDIKPENILLHDGRPMVADFGIALAVSAAAGGRMTETGLSLGTPHYMSPEQATADKDITARSDVYSLGSVLYEMLAGEPPHTGGSAQAVIMKIVTVPADPVTDLRKSVPPNVADAVAQALEKVPADRFESARAFADALTNPGFTAATTRTVASNAGATSGTNRSTVTATAAAAAFALLAVWGWLRPPPDIPEPITTRAQITGLDYTNSGGGAGSQLAISPDGSWIAAAGRLDGGDFMIHLRRVGDAEWRPLPNTESGMDPAFSPTGESLAFIDTQHGRQIMKMPISGGPALPVTAGGGDLHWAHDDTILFSRGGSIYRVSANGGEPELLIEYPQARHPHLLPDGSGVLFSSGPVRDSTSRVLLWNSGTSNVTELAAQGGEPRYVPTGHVIFGHVDDVLMAMTFDLETHTAGTPVLALPSVRVHIGGATLFGLSNNGTLVYNSTAGQRNNARLLSEVSMDGTPNPLSVRPALLAAPRYSPDGRRIAFTEGPNSQSAIQVYDLATGAAPEFASRDSHSRFPVWPEASDYIYFSAYSTTQFTDGFRRRADTSMPVESIIRHEFDTHVSDVLPGDSVLLMRVNVPGRDRDLMVLRLNSDGSIPESPVLEPYLNAEWREFKGKFSPDGQLVAYVSNEPGEERVYVQPFPVPTGPRPVSPEFGTDPVWAPNGRTIYYRGGSGTTFFAVDIISLDPWAVGAPRELFDHPAHAPGVWVSNYDVHPNGDRFVLTVWEDLESMTRQIVHVVYLVTNWFTELQQRVGN